MLQNKLKQQKLADDAECSEYDSGLLTPFWVSVYSEYGSYKDVKSHRRDSLVITSMKVLLLILRNWNSRQLTQCYTIIDLCLELAGRFIVTLLYLWSGMYICLHHSWCLWVCSCFCTLVFNVFYVSMDPRGLIQIKWMHEWMYSKAYRQRLYTAWIMYDVYRTQFRYRMNVTVTSIVAAASDRCYNSSLL